MNINMIDFKRSRLWISVLSLFSSFKIVLISMMIYRYIQIVDNIAFSRKFFNSLTTDRSVLEMIGGILEFIFYIPIIPIIFTIIYYPIILVCRLRGQCEWLWRGGWSYIIGLVTMPWVYIVSLTGINPLFIVLPYLGFFLWLTFRPLPYEDEATM